MKITMNSIGTYSLRNINSKPPQNIVKEKKPEQAATVSNKEKEFFAKMYPQKREEIINYHFYSKSGEKSGVALGKNIDRRM